MAPQWAAEQTIGPATVLDSRQPQEQPIAELAETAVQLPPDLRPPAHCWPEHSAKNEAPPRLPPVRAGHSPDADRNTPGRRIPSEPAGWQQWRAESSSVEAFPLR